MIKKLSILLFLAFSLPLTSQVWCTPNSEWYFSHSNFGIYGYKKSNYLYDTLIAGKNCNKIKVNTVGYSMVPPNNFNLTDYLYTYINNKVVYIKDVMQPGTNNFDTIFNFNAAIGSKWRMAPTSVSACAMSFVTVLDTGRRTIQGLSLKWLKVNYTNNGGLPLNVNDTIYERLGGLFIYPYWPGNTCPTTTDAGAGGPLRCFSDNQIINHKNNWTAACDDYYTSLKENSGLSELNLYPNPNNGILNIEMEIFNEEPEIQIKNTLGEMLLSEKIKTNTSHIDLSNLLNGIYFVSLKQSSGIKTLKIVKE